MTDEEMADVRVKSYGMDLCCYCRECDKGKNNPCEHKKDALHGYKDGFLAGLKAGRDMNVSTKWHKLDWENDYPDVDKLVDVSAIKSTEKK